MLPTARIFLAFQDRYRWPPDATCLFSDTSAHKQRIERTKGVKQENVRAGNGLLKEQANELLNAPDPSTLKGNRDRAILALLISCGLRRAGLVGQSRSNSLILQRGRDDLLNFFR